MVLPIHKIGFGEGVMRGPNMTIRFGVASAADRKLFDSLLVLQAVWDRIDEKYVWADRTIRAPESGAPDFNSKTIRARADDLGVFVIARGRAATGRKGRCRSGGGDRRAAR